MIFEGHASKYTTNIPRYAYFALEKNDHDQSFESLFKIGSWPTAVK